MGISEFIEVMSANTKRIGVALGTVAGVAVGWKLYKERHLPPGPRRWFNSGGILSGDHESIELEYAKLAKQYGDVFSLYIGRQLTVILASHSAIKDAFVKQGEAFAHRPPGTHNLINFMGMKDDIFSTPYQTEGWNQNKSFILSCLRTAGFGQAKGTEDRILDQVENLITYLDRKADTGSAINFRDILPKATMNIIFNIIFSRSYDYDDPKLDEILEALRQFLSCFNYVFLLDKYHPAVAKLLHYSIVRKIQDSVAAMRQIIGKEVQEHIISLDPTYPRDFVDNYLIKRGSDDIPRLIDNVIPLLPDASDTMSLSMEWVILYITHYQDVQQKIFTEIVKVTDGSRNVQWTDRPFLVYTEACIREVIRLSPAVTLTAAHAVIKDTYLRGYRIPKEAAVYGLLHNSLRDPHNYADPDKFRPERFIDENGDLIKSDAWSPFGMGRRKCPGEQVSQIEFFLIVANLVQQFHIQFSTGEMSSLEMSMENLIRAPKQFNVLLKKRAH